jgi:hypothetical protein
VKDPSDRDALWWTGIMTLNVNLRLFCCSSTPSSPSSPSSSSYRCSSSVVFVVRYVSSYSWQLMQFERRTSLSYMHSYLHHCYSLDERHLVHTLPYLHHTSYLSPYLPLLHSFIINVIDYWDGNEGVAVTAIVAGFQLLYFVLG